MCFNPIKAHFQQFISELKKQRSTSAEYHRLILTEHRIFAASLPNDLVCLVCLKRKPEKYLPCGHSTCEACVEIFGKSIVSAPYTYRLDECLICGCTSGLELHIKPPTAGIRLLSIDGGGVRGVLPLKALAQLEKTLGESIGFTYPIQDNFDLAIGTSSGNIGTLSLSSMLTGRCRWLDCLWPFSEQMVCGRMSQAVYHVGKESICPTIKILSFQPCAWGYLDLRQGWAVQCQQHGIRSSTGFWS